MGHAFAIVGLANLHLGYFGLVFVQREEVETRQPSLYAVYGPAQNQEAVSYNFTHNCLKMKNIARGLFIK